MTHGETQQNSIVETARQMEYQRNLALARAQQRRNDQQYNTFQNDNIRPLSIQNNIDNELNDEILMRQYLNEQRKKYTKKYFSQETNQIFDDVEDMLKNPQSVKKITKIALHSRAALKDYTSKWWMVAFVLAGIKDGVIDTTVVFTVAGWVLNVYFFIFLFGGGFVKKRLKKVIFKMIILYIISFIPIVNIIIPETMLAVFIRWDGSRKEYEKAKRRMDNIKKATE